MISVCTPAIRENTERILERDFVRCRGVRRGGAGEGEPVLVIHAFFGGCDAGLVSVGNQFPGRQHAHDRRRRRGALMRRPL